MSTAEDDDDHSPLESAPLAVHAALLAQDIQALDLALRQMPADEAEALARWLVESGILAERSADDLDREQEQAYQPMEQQPSARPSAWPSNWPPAVAKALASGNTDKVYEALAELLPEDADRLYLQLKEQGLL